MSWFKCPRNGCKFETNAAETAKGHLQRAHGYSEGAALGELKEQWRETPYYEEGQRIG